jgi:hypothetical protein
MPKTDKGITRSKNYRLIPFLNIDKKSLRKDNKTKSSSI